MYNIILFLIVTFITYLLIVFYKRQKMVVNGNKNNNFFISSISRCLEEMYKRNIISQGKKYYTTSKVLIFCVILFVISILILYSIIGMLSTSIILSLTVLVSPIIISKLLIRSNKRKIIRQLPMYAVNIKNYITEENNIVSAIRKAKSEDPLAFFIEKFKQNVSRGMNVIQAFDILKNDVDVKEFNDLISSFELCYKNGGNFVEVLEKYILIITKEATYKDEMEEKSFSSILTLIIMLVLNVIVVLVFILKNEEYSQIIRGTFVGQMILNVNAMSYMIIAWLISKIYKEE